MMSLKCVAAAKPAVAAKVQAKTNVKQMAVRQNVEVSLISPPMVVGEVGIWSGWM